MTNLFMYILPLSLKACVVIPLIMAVRFLIRKQPKIYSYALWSVVFMGLVFNIEIRLDKINPFFTPVQQVQSRVSSQYTELLNDYVGETEIYHNNTLQYYEAVEKGIVPTVTDDGRGSYVVTAPGGCTPPATVQTGIMPKLAIIWAVGILVITFYLLKNLLNFNAGVIFTHRLKDNIYFADGVTSPFVYGIIRPKICIPSAMADMPLEQIIAHEQVHIKRKDYIIKPLCLLICLVHWFNPLVWLAFRLMCRDMEMACDEAVINRTGGRKEYSLRLLECAAPNHSSPVAAVLFGESNAESRIKNVLAYRKPAKIISLLLCAVVAICCTACMVSEKAEEAISTVPKTFYEKLAELNSTEDVEYKNREVAEGITQKTLETAGIEAPTTLPDKYTSLPYYVSKGYKYEKDGKTTYSYAYISHKGNGNRIYAHICDDIGGSHLGFDLSEGEKFISFAGGLEVLNNEFSVISYISEDANGDILLNIRKMTYFTVKEEADIIRHKLDKNNYFRVRGLRFLNENVAFMGQTDTGFIKEDSPKSSYTSHETPQANISIDGGKTWQKLDFSQLALPEYFTGYRSCCMTLTEEKIEFRYFVNWQQGVDPWYTGAEPYSIISYDGGLTWAGYSKKHDTENGGFVFTQLTDPIPVSIIEE